jgi:magnesium transporter
MTLKVNRMDNQEEKPLMEQFIDGFRDQQEVRTLLDELQPYDKAKVYLNLPEEYKKPFLLELHSEEIAEVLQEIEESEQSVLIERLGVDHASSVLNLMSSDDVADLLGNMEQTSVDALLTTMEYEEAEKVIELLQYPQDSAGGIMTSGYVWVKKWFTVAETIEKLRAFAKIVESIYYIYVLNEKKELIGALSIRDLLLSEPKQQVSEIMFERVISVGPYTDQEEVAKIMQRYDFVALPVIDDHQQLIGIITIDDVIDVVIEEAQEDISRLSAAGVQTTTQTTAFHSAIRRLPWLILLLFIGMISGSIISQFENTLHAVVALTFFMPMIAGMTGNTGTQSLAVVIQALARGEIERGEALKWVRREAGVGFIIGSVCGVLITILGIVWQGDPTLGMVVGISLFATLIIGTLAGTVVPIVLHYLKVDPTVASGPLMTTLNDIFSLLIYLSIASLFLQHL